MQPTHHGVADARLNKVSTAKCKCDLEHSTDLMPDQSRGPSGALLPLLPKVRLHGLHYLLSGAFASTCKSPSLDNTAANVKWLKASVLFGG